VATPLGAAPDRDPDDRAKAIAQGRADARAGRVVPLEEIEAWIETVGTPHERPVPQSGKR
jgi:predicted transcriptional regulator